jgi:plasmid stability protein
MTVNLPDDVARRLAAEAARRGTSVDDLAAELVAANLPAEAAVDPLEAFVGSGASGRCDLGRRHREIRAEMTEGLAAREL